MADTFEEESYQLFKVANILALCACKHENYEKKMEEKALSQPTFDTSLKKITETMQKVLLATKKNDFPLVIQNQMKEMQNFLGNLELASQILYD
jgi:hypothetical protein